MLSLTTASTRPWSSSAAAWANCSTFSTFAPASLATWYQLLVADCAVVLPRRSLRLWMSLLSAAVTMTPWL
jgi:hypothetical protein